MNNRDVGAASALALLLAGFSIAGCLSPSALTWGFHALGFLPPVWLAGYCAAAALVVVAARKGWLAPLGAILVRFMETTPYQFLVAVIGAGILAAVVFRVQAPLLGDGFFLVRNFADALHGTAPCSTATNRSGPPGTTAS